MRSTYFLGMFVVGAVAAVAGGCGDDSSGTGGAGGTSTSTTTTTTAATTGPTTGTGGTMSDGNDTIETATEFDYGTEFDGQLDPPASDVDYYSFTGLKDQRVLIQITAKTGPDPFDTTYIDSVVTLYDSNGVQIAQNDDPEPRFSNDSQLFTVLPADGTYYARVAECNFAFPQGCANVDDITITDYTLYIGDINPDILVTEASPPPDIQYVQGANGYGAKLLTGGFSMDAETDGYMFTNPDVPDPAGERRLFSLSFFTGGVDGSGSTTDIQRVTIKDPTTLETIAEARPDLGSDINAPLGKGVPYLLEVTHETGAVGSNPFYYVFNFPDTGSNPVEQQDVANNTTPETLNPVDQGDGVTAYFIEGDIGAAGVDIDQFSFAIPAGAQTINAICGAQRSGSGLRNLKLELQDSAGTPLTNGTATETEADDALVTDVNVPAGSAILHLTATQELTVLSSYYRCGIYVIP